jgi:hypothetical protein
MSESWTTRGLDANAVEALTRGLPASRLWSLLLHVLAARSRREPARILDQWSRDGFTAPADVDQRTFLELDRLLLGAAAGFDAIELSPVAPLGASSAIALTSQNRVVSALRGCEVVSDPTNVMALECARRLRRNSDRVVRLATTHRCVRAQPFPKLPGFAAHFRVFCLTTGTLKGPNHDVLVGALVDHVRVHVRALEATRSIGFECANVRVEVLGTPERAGIADRLAEAFGAHATRGALEHRYYDGVRFTISARAPSGDEVPLADGGAFDWLTRLTGNRKLALVASGLGTQRLAAEFKPPQQQSEF